MHGAALLCASLAAAPNDAGAWDDARIAVAAVLASIAWLVCAASAIGQVKAEGAIARVHLGAPASVAGAPLFAAALLVAPHVDGELRAAAVLSAAAAFFASPVVGHALARAAHHRDHPQARKESRA